MAQKITVSNGDCLSSIAFGHGFFIDTLWSHARNSELRTLRGSPYVLEAGDVVFVPDLRQDLRAAETGKRHSYRRHGVPEWLRVQLADADEKPRPGLAYTLHIDGRIEKSGMTDSDGWVIEAIPPDALHGVLILPDDERYELQLGHLGPADTIRGMQQRLHNLGYRCSGDAPGKLSQGTWAAIQQFMQDETGAAISQDDTRLPDVQQLLQQKHGS